MEKRKGGLRFASFLLFVYWLFAYCCLLPLSLLVSPCLSLCWDCDGEVLCAVQEGSNIVSLFEPHSRKVTPLDIQHKDPSIACWNKKGPQVGSKGGVMAGWS